MTKARIGVIGAGAFANWVHYPSLAEIEGCEIAAVCDLDPKRRANVGQRYGVDARFSDYREMTRAMDLDAVYVLMRADLLEAPVTHCLSNGLNVFIEKPPGVTSRQLERWVDLAAENGCKTMVGFNRRFAPLMVEAKRIVEESGPVTLCVAHYSKNLLAQTTTPLGPGAPHALLLQESIHGIDTLRWLGGEAADVQSRVTRRFHDYADGFYAMLQFGSGAQGIFMSNFAAGGRIETYEFHGKGVSARIVPPYEARVSTADGELTVKTSDLTGVAEAAVSACKLKGDGVTHRIYGYIQESRHFIECIREDRMPLTHFGDALETMRLAETIAGRKP